MYFVVNLEMFNSLKSVLFNYIFVFLKAVINFTTNARCVLSILYTVSVLILHCKDLSFSVIASCHVLISQNITHASGSKCHMCVKNLTAICNWGFLWKAQGTREMGVSSRVNEGTSIVKGLDNTGYLSIHEQGLALKFFFFFFASGCLWVTESLESFST